MSWRSSLEVYDLASGRCSVILRTERLIEAPNWHPEGWFLVNGEGRLWRASPAGLEPIATPEGLACNNDHGFLPDGRIVFSAHQGLGAEIHVLGEGLMLPERPSWWHAAQGRRIAYACARGDRVVRVAVRDLETGVETVLTPGPGHHDGPDFAPDGTVWFNSDASGHAQIWRVGADGPQQVFADECVNWFPHPSPDGAYVLYLSYPPGTEGHPRDLDVALCLLDVATGKRQQVVTLFGGQGSINVPCWAPDGRRFAFMRYAPVA